LAGTENGIFLSNNNGKSWTSSGLINTFVSALVVSGTSIFAGTGSGVFISNNNGNTWAPCNNDMPNSDVRALTTNAGKIFAGTNGNGVFLSINNGKNWIPVNNNLTDYVVHSLTIFGTNVFAGTDHGVLLSTNYGGTWIPFNIGLEYSQVKVLTIDGGFIFAGTYGTGVWKRPLSELSKLNYVSNNKKLIIYPNPTQGKFVINGINKINSVAVYNLLGEVVYSNTNVNQLVSREIDLSYLEKGIYLVTVYGDDGELNKKIVIE
jgi:ligand-binding sensor domain-containing protein